MRLLYAILLAMSLVAVGVAEDVALVQDSLQAAINAGGTVYLKKGIYRQTVTIDRSVNIVGLGSGRTVVDGDGRGSVFTIGKANPNIDVKLSGMIIRGGKNDIVGGINNFGRLVVEDSTITGNNAEFGGGIFNHNGTSTVTIDNVDIAGNSTTSDGAGIYNSVGKLIVNSGNITENVAEATGGGIFNDFGNIIIKGGSIARNTAKQTCGGVLSLGAMGLIGGSVVENVGGNIYVPNNPEFQR